MMNFRNKHFRAFALLLCVLLCSCFATAALAAAVPSLSSFRIEENGEILYPGDTVTVSVKVTSRAAIEKVYTRLTGPETIDIAMEYSGGRYVGSYTFTDEDINGEYTARYVIAVDVNGGKDTLANPEGEVLLDGATEDPDCPTLRSFTLKEDGETLLPGEAAHLTCSAKSNSGSKLSEVRVELTGPEKITVFLSYSSSTGLWSGSYTFGTSNLNGDYEVTGIFIKDSAGHGSYMQTSLGSVSFYAQLVESITLNHTERELVITTEESTPHLTLKATVLPTTAANRNVVWSTSDKTVATVNKKGYVTVTGTGECKITCKAADTSKVKAVCKLTVINQPVESIKLNMSYHKSTILSTYTQPQFDLKATVKPDTAINRKVVWSSSDTDVAKVNSKGHVTCLAAGTAVITCTAKDGSGVKASCKVVVTSKLGTDIVLNKNGIKLVRTAEDKKPTYLLTATILPEDAVKTGLRWTSSNTSVATVEGGKVTAVGAGTATIKCVLKDDTSVYATCKVTVKNRGVNIITLNKSTLTLKITKNTPQPTYRLTAATKPADAISTKLSWSSSDESVATVSANGVVTAVGEGECVITCRAKTGSGVAKCAVTVK